MQITIDTLNERPNELRALADMLIAIAGPAARQVKVDIAVSDDPASLRRAMQEHADKITASAAPLKMGDVSHLAADKCPSHGKPERDPNEEIYIHHPESCCVLEGTVADLEADPNTVEVDLETYERLLDEYAHAGTGPELDANNLPWDERIHSSNRAKNADGTWRRRRGIDDELFNAVVAELRGEVAPEEAPKPTPPSLFDTPPPSMPDAPVAAESIFAPPPPPAPAAIAPSTVASAARPVNFADLVAAIVAQGIAADKVTAACTAEGVANLAVLGAQPGKVAAVAARLGL